MPIAPVLLNSIEQIYRDLTLSANQNRIRMSCAAVNQLSGVDIQYHVNHCEEFVESLNGKLIINGAKDLLGRRGYLKQVGRFSGQQHAVLLKELRHRYRYHRRRNPMTTDIQHIYCYIVSERKPINNMIIFMIFTFF